MKKTFFALMLSLCLLFCVSALAEEPAVKGFKLDGGKAICLVGGTLQLTTDNVRPEGAVLPPLTYTSSHEKIATVDENGLVTGLSRGTTRITATIEGTHIRATLNVRVQQGPTEIQLSAKNLVLAEGKRERVVATVLPKNTDNKRLTWSTSDASLATVDGNGNIHCIGTGAVTITATSVVDPSVSASISIVEEVPATKVSFPEKEVNVMVGQTMPLTWTVEPADTTTHSVTFSSNHEKTATVDENGMVTGVKAGYCTVTVETADDTRKRAHITVNVLQPVEGVSLKKDEIRVGVGNYGSLYAILQPTDATNENMTWTSSEDVIATVSGTGLHAKVRGHAWGTATITGTTEDGGFTTTATVHIGSYAHALRLDHISIRNGKPYLKLTNVSNLDITEVRYVMRGFDEQVNPVTMSTRGRNTNMLYGTYEHELQPDDSTEHGKWSFNHPSDYADLERLDFAITGFTCADGFEWNCSESNWNWHEFDSDYYKQVQNNPRAN